MNTDWIKWEGRKVNFPLSISTSVKVCNLSLLIVHSFLLRGEVISNVVWQNPLTKYEDSKSLLDNAAMHACMAAFYFLTLTASRRDSSVNQLVITGVYFIMQLQVELTDTLLPIELFDHYFIVLLQPIWLAQMSVCLREEIAPIWELSVLL